MKFQIDDVTVYFPYEFIYPEQYNYMLELKKALDANGAALLEMPSGTGKTITLLSFIISYQMVHPEKSKLVYCSRTVPEIEKTLAELRNLVRYIELETGTSMDFLGIGLSSRKNLCTNPQVNRHSNGAMVDSMCHNLTASWARSVDGGSQQEARLQTCDFFERLEALKNAPNSTLAIPYGIYTLEELVEYGKANGICPYFLARSLLPVANVIVYSFYYLLDPKVASFVSKEISKDSIIVVDEAHNIDNVCIESMSVDISRPTIEASLRCIRVLDEKIRSIKEKDSTLLQGEYQTLIEGLRRSGDARITDQFLANPIVPTDVLNEAVPGNIRKAEHFVSFLKRFIEFLRSRLKGLNVTSELPMAFLQSIRETALIERKPLRFAAERLASLIKTLHLSNIHEYSALQRIANFATICSTYLVGFCIIFEPFDSMRPSVPNPVLHLCCMDSSIAIKPVFDRFKSIVITSGTLSPLEMYPKILNFRPVLMESFPMSLSRNAISPLIVTRGNDQTPLTSRFDQRTDPTVIRNYAQLLVEFCSVTPDGLVAFFPSYTYLESIILAWNELNIFSQILRYKLVFIETPDAAETSRALENYKLACNVGRGALLLSVARGKVSEGVDFEGQYGRCVIMFGIPYQNTESRLLKERLEYLRDQFGIKENDFLTFDALRQASQCLGRVLRGKDDYGLMVFADRRYSRNEKLSKLPKWIAQSILEANLSISTEMAVHIARNFFREMAQPLDAASQLGTTLWSAEHLPERDQSIQGIAQFGVN